MSAYLTHFPVLQKYHSDPVTDKKQFVMYLLPTCKHNGLTCFISVSLHIPTYTLLKNTLWVYWHIVMSNKLCMEFMDSLWDIRSKNNRFWNSKQRIVIRVLARGQWDTFWVDNAPRSLPNKLVSGPTRRTGKRSQATRLFDIHTPTSNLFVNTVVWSTSVPKLCT